MKVKLMNENKIFKTSVKMFIRLLSYYIMCLVVSVTVMAIFHYKIGNIVAQIFDTCIVTILPYLSLYSIGTDDSNKVSYGHTVRDDLKGLKIGLVATAPFVLIGLFLIAAKLGVMPENYISYYRLLSSPYMPLNHMIMPTTLTLAEQSWTSVIASVLTAFIPAVACAVGYKMGFEEISFTDEWIYRGKRKIK